jgi:hypothetical protein
VIGARIEMRFAHFALGLSTCIVPGWDDSIEFFFQALTTM